MKKFYVYLFLLFSVSPLLLGDTPDPLTATEAEIADTLTCYTAEEMPEPIGGMEALAKRIVYPEEAKKYGVEGSVFVQFTVNEQGKVVDASIFRSDSELLNESALTAVKGMSFKPGKNAGKPVKIKLTIPVKYALADKEKPAAPEEQPFPVGGMQALMKNIVYPEDAIKANVQGKVLLKAIIDEKGNVGTVTILKNLSPSCDKAAITAIKATKFTPVKKNGKTVKSEVVLPIMFKLQ